MEQPLILDPETDCPMQIILDIPEELISQLSAIEQQIPEALRLGLQAIAARPQKGFAGFAEVVEFGESADSRGDFGVASFGDVAIRDRSAIGKTPIAKSHPSGTRTLAAI
jgi:hypothetical protein